MAVGLALDFERLQVAHRHPAHGVFGELDRVTGEQLAVFVEDLADPAAEDDRQMGPGGLAHGLERPAELDLVDRGAQRSERVGGRAHGGGDLVVDVEAAEVDAAGDLHARHRRQLGRDRELGPQRGDVFAVRSGHDVLEQAAVVDGACQRSLVAVVVEVEGR